MSQQIILAEIYIASICDAGFKNPYPPITRKLKAAKYEIQKPSTCCATLFHCKFSSMFPRRFSPCVINLSGNKNICCGLKKVVAKSRARVYFEQQIFIFGFVARFSSNSQLVAQQICSCPSKSTISAPHFFNLQQMFLLRVKLITQGEKRETSTKTCNKTMLCDKLKVFVSRISPPLQKPVCVSFLALIVFYLPLLQG